MLPALAGVGESALGPGDTVRIVVAEDPDLTTEARISADGKLGLPLLGEVAVGSHTPGEVARLIADGLTKGRFLRDPHVSVALVDPRSRHVLVLGHVARPGLYPLGGGGDRLTDFLALAGGRTESGSDHVIVTHRDGDPHRVEVDLARMYHTGDLTDDIDLDSGDVIFVPEAPVFYVYGAVQRAGMYRLETETSVRAALSVGGGLTERASRRGITIHRRMPDGTTRELHAGLADRVEANDVIFVKESLF
jgi:polysaccharide export outer membrane protein